MPYRRIFFEKYQPFHIISRAVEGIKIFKNIEDCYRFIFRLYVANLGARGFNLKSRDIIKAARALLQGEEIPSKFIIKQHSPLVHLLDFALVITHYHLYLVPNIENGVPIFMKKVNGGFAKYFNLKHQRRDVLFGSRYRSVLVKTELHSEIVSRYVSVINPLDVYQPNWRKRGLRDWQGAFKFLQKYQFSSFPDKIGQRQSKILAPEEILKRYSLGRGPGSQKKYKAFMRDFLKQKFDSLRPFFLE